MTSRRMLLIAVPVLLVAGLLGGPWLYANVIRDDAPAELSLADTASSARPSAPEASAATVEEATTPEAAPSPPAADVAGDLGGTYEIADGSQAGYRVAEVLFGQNVEAVGRTSAVTGEMTVVGTTISAASFTVDMTSLASDEPRRDRQFAERIMDVATYPTAAFVLSEPIELGGVPADLEVRTLTAAGDLTIRGVTRPVTFELTARRNGEVIEVDGDVPITFADFGVPDASFGPAEVEPRGTVEVLLVFARST